MKKIIKIFIPLILLIIQFLGVTKSVKAANIGELKELERGELGYYCVQKWNGTKWVYLTYNQTFYTDIDGQKYIAYCLSPGLPGIGYVSGEKQSYQVKIDNISNDDIIWRILKNGYPNKTINELGVETSDDAYFATMQAINSVLRGYSLEQAKQLYCVGQFAINGENYEDIQRRGKKTLDAMFNLIDIGLNGTETRNQFLQVFVEKTSELKEENDEYYSQTFKINSSSEILNYEISNIQNLPENSYVSDIQGNYKNIFKGGEQFKVMISKSEKLHEINGSISLKVLQKNYPVYYGISQIQGFQDYALCNNSYSEVLTDIKINEKIDKSKLTIIKIDGETNQTLKGVKFEIIYSDGTKKEMVTDENGKIEIINQIPGNIYIKEIESIGKYKINDKQIKVDLKYGEQKEIYIKNELKKGNIKIIKIDKDNNEIKLKGVLFNLKDENNNVVKQGYTDDNGELLFENLVIGQYKLVEIQTNSEYMVLNDEIEIQVIDNKTQQIKIENEKIKIPEKQEQPQQPEKIQENVKKLPKTGDYFNKQNLYKSVIYMGLGFLYFIKKYLTKI